jgi:hypothetical protein
METEIWKAIPGYEGRYEVSSIGRIKSLNYNRTGKPGLIKLSMPARGYYQVCLQNRGNKRTYTVQQLVAMAFLGHVPNGNKTAVDHINSNEYDNRVENLRVVTQRENLSKERTKKSGLPVGVYKNKSGKFVAQIREGKKMHSLGSYLTPEEASEAYQKKLVELLGKQ